MGKETLKIQHIEEDHVKVLKVEDYLQIWKNGNNLTYSAIEPIKLNLKKRLQFKDTYDANANIVVKGSSNQITITDVEEVFK